MGIQINQLSRLDELTDADLLAVWGSSVGDTRAAAMSLVYSYLLGKLDVTLPQMLTIVGVALTAPLDTAENIVGSIVIPGGTIGAAGCLRLAALLAVTSSGNNKTVRVRLGGIAGTIIYSGVISAVVSAELSLTLWNRALPNSQISGGKMVTSGLAVVGAASITSAVDTSVDQTLVITVQKATGAEVATLEAFNIEVLPGT